MNMIVIGCGRVGSELAYHLFKRGHQVTVVDFDPNAFDQLPSDFRGRTLVGEATNQNVLQRAGIEDVDGMAVVTNSDTVNAVVAHAARIVYSVPNIVVRDYDPSWRKLYEAFGLQVISSSSWGAQRIEEMLDQPGIRTVFSAGNGEVEVYEVLVPPALSGHTADELVPAAIPASLVGLTRAGQAQLAGQDTVLTEGDILLISATYDGILAVRSNLNKWEVK